VGTPHQNAAYLWVILLSARGSFLFSLPRFYKYFPTVGTPQIWLMLNEMSGIAFPGFRSILGSKKLCGTRNYHSVRVSRTANEQVVN